MIFRPLEKVRTLLQAATGLDIMYAYDDLVFAEYGVFLFQFDDDDPQHLWFFVSKEFDEKSHSHEIEKLNEAAAQLKIKVDMKGRFALEQAGDEVSVSFSD